MGDAENPEELARHVLSALSEQQKERQKTAARVGGAAAKGGQAVQKLPTGGRGRALADDLNKKVWLCDVMFRPFPAPCDKRHITNPTRVPSQNLGQKYNHSLVGAGVTRTKQEYTPLPACVRPLDPKP